MITDKTVFISLTGKNSHKIKIPAGQGSFSIGTRGISDGKYDVMVEPDKAIIWDSFNIYFTPLGARYNKLYPYGDWPRFFYYSGNDTGFIEWSNKRHIEDFHWFPKEDVCVDLSNSNISRLSIHTDNVRVCIKNIGENTSDLFLSGKLENFQIRECDKAPRLYLTPTPLEDNTRSYTIPHFEKLSKATLVEINSSVVGSAFDCASLLQFQNIKNLNLTGRLINLEALSQLRFLETIGIRFSPDLTGFPHLKTWNNLKGFIGWNIEKIEGKRLKAELQALMAEKDLQYSSVSQLRKKGWFTTEYELPFSAWKGKLAKTATKAYKTSLKEIKNAKTEKEVHDSIVSFLNVFNKLDGIETDEREDIGSAVEKLVTASSLDIPPESWQDWFDSVRDF